MLCVYGGGALWNGLEWLLLRYGWAAHRIEFYSDRVIFWHEQAWAWPKMEARYEDIRGACINKGNEVGDHVEARIEGGGTREVDTLCVYCKKGEYILFGIHKWGEEYSRRILDEILRRADAPESEPEEGEYGGGSRIAEEGFAELGVEEEPLPEDNPEENRFDIEAIVGCELYTKNGVRLGKIVQVLPAETDIYIVARDGKEMRLPAEEGIILDMDVERTVGKCGAATKFLCAALRRRQYAISAKNSGKERRFARAPRGDRCIFGRQRNKRLF